ncbi:porin family protein [Prevotella sp. 10(H)]|uniref:porin family protein n=1 Tax=Prevotella sp. 10(H) TaxID=1158294 RepID=UPI0004A6DF5E|nr:porin family protein [Prevotella sp. 10(H)]
MKTTFKSCLVIITLLLFVTSANAQDKPLTFGVKAGMNLSNFSGDLSGDAKIGFNVGLTMDYSLAQDIYLMTELKYSLEGSKDDGTKINMSYLKLPVHIGYKLAITDNTRIVFQGGPYIGYALSGKYKAGPISVDAFDQDLADVVGYKMKRFDFGLGLGVGAEFDKICVGLGYDFGLINVLDVQDKSAIGELTGISDPSGKNMNGYLTVGYKF